MASWYSTALASSFLAASLLSLAGCSSSSDLPVLGSVPAFQLTDQNNHDFDSSKTLQSTIWIADFMFTNCPGPCPRMSSQLKQAQTYLTNTGVKIISFSVDPTHDTPQVLFDYSRHFDARSGTWYFLTGPRATLQTLSRDAFKLADVDDTLDHSIRFVLVDRKSRIRGYYLSSEPRIVDQLVADARALLKERG
jgi:protein SCO1/2